MMTTRDGREGEKNEAEKEGKQEERRIITMMMMPLLEFPGMECFLYVSCITYVLALLCFILLSLRVSVLSLHVPFTCS